MVDEKTYTIAQAHYLFAEEFNRKTWDLLEMPERTRFDEARMVDCAHASLAHWRITGTAVRQQRGEWLISRVYAVLGDGVQALKHAQLSYEILISNRNEMDDTDPAYVYEAIARGYALQGERDDAVRFIAKAQAAGEAIKDDSARETFFADFNNGEWNGMK